MNEPVAPAWHIITCEYPPQIGGVSDHSQMLAMALAQAGHDVHVWCPRVEDAESEPGRDDSMAQTAARSASCLPRVHPEFGRFSVHDLRRVGTLLDQFPAPRRLLVQWVPHGYGWRSLNMPFALWLDSRALAGDRVELLVHEPYMDMSASPVRFAAATVHRLMLVAAGASAARLWVSTPSWQRAVRPYLRPSLAIEWLPVPSSLPLIQNPGAVADTRRGIVPDGRLLVGHFSTYSPLISDLLRRSVLHVLECSAASVLLMGRGSAAFRQQLIEHSSSVADRVVATGVLEPVALSRHIQACDVMLQPYPDGVSARRTTAIALLAHGRAVVTNAGRLTEPLWAESKAVELTADDVDVLASRTVALLDHDSDRTRLGVAAKDLYSRLFDVRHAVAKLNESTRFQSVEFSTAAVN